MESLSERKQNFRLEVKKVPDLSYSERDNISSAIAERLIHMPQFNSSSSIFAFVGIGNEPDTSAIIEHALKAGKRVSVPLCMSDGIMEAREIHSLSELKTGKYGIKEPGIESLVVAPEAIDFVLVPCVACTMDGRRLGHGKGYYDRFLPKTEALRVMICAQRFVFDDIPSDELDCKSDFVVTENECYSALR